MYDINKKNIYLEKLNFYNSVNNTYKSNKYNYKLSQYGGLTDDEKLSAVINTFLEDNKTLTQLICSDNKDSDNDKSKNYKYNNIVTGADNIKNKLIKCYNYNSKDFKFIMRDNKQNDKKYTIIKNKDNNFIIQDYKKNK